MVKKIYSNGLISIPKSIRQQLTSDKVELTVVKNEKGDNVVMLTPIGQDKQAKVVYE